MRHLWVYKIEENEAVILDAMPGELVEAEQRVVDLHRRWYKI